MTWNYPIIRHQKPSVWFGLLGAALVALAGASTPAAASPNGFQVDTDGNALYDACNVTTQQDCGGFIMGVVTGISFARDTCWAKFPPNVVGEQIIDVVVTGLKSHPEERQRPAYFLIAKYISAAWPCP
jgi:hypothetical protein